MANNLELQGGVYHVRLAVPKDVRKAFGDRRILSQSLKTGSIMEAMNRRLRYLADWKAQIQAARVVTPMYEGWQGDVTQAIEELELMVQGQKRGLIGEVAPPLPEVDPKALARMRANPRLIALAEDRMKDGVVAGKLRLLDEVREGAKLIIPSMMARRHNLSSEQQEEVRAFIADPVSYRPKSPITSAMLAAFRVFRVERHVSLQGIDAQESKLLRLSDYLNKTGKTLDFDCVAVWLDSLQVTSKTKQQYLIAGSTFWKWAMKYDSRWREDFKGAISPFGRHDLPRLKGRAAKENERKVFNLDDFPKLHSAALEQGLGVLADLILLGYYTGARIGEICNLRAEHIVTVDGVQSFNIDDSKTVAGIRVLPIHPELTAVVKRLVDSSVDGYLVATSFMDKYGKRAGALSKVFGTLKRDLGYDDKHVFHSIRGTVATQLSRHDIQYPMICELIGHDTKLLVFDTYSEGFSAAQKLEAISRIPVLPLANTPSAA